MLSRPAKLPTKSCVRNPWRTAIRRSSGVPKHASASLAVLDLVMASPAQPAARRSPRRLCLLSARSDDQPLPRSDQKGKLFKLNIHIHITTSSTVFEGYSPLSGPGTARYLIRVQPVFCELSLICISVSASSAAHLR